MAQGMNSTKIAALPSHEALENKPGSLNPGAETEAKRIDQNAMQMAKRAQNRIKANQDTNPGETIFTK